MRKGKSLIGMPIVGQDDGTRLGTVKDLIFDHDTNEVLALVLAEKDLFGLIDALIVPWRHVRTIGSDVIFAANGHSAMKLREDPRSHGLIQRETVLSGTQVLSTDGKYLGTLADMCIDEATGRVVGYEVSSGFIADTLHGKKFLPAPPGLAIGRDAAIARPAAEAELKAETEAQPENGSNQTVVGHDEK